jgi:catechol 2,3-dioxygenase
MVTNSEKSHDLGLLLDPTDMRGRLHHLAYWVDSRDELLRAADILLNADIAIEFGPGRHGMGEQDYLYVREPGGARIEINTGGYRLYVPDWETKKWTPAQGSNSFYRNMPSPDSMMEAVPPPRPEAVASTETVNPWAAASVS